MSAYTLAVLCLALALVAQCIAVGIATEKALRPPYRRATLVFAIACGFLALQNGYNLELALHTGIFDLRQAVLAAGAALLLLGGIGSFRRAEPERPPPR